MMKDVHNLVCLKRIEYQEQSLPAYRSDHRTSPSIAFGLHRKRRPEPISVSVAA
jgi:hypothetical protein